MFNARLSELDRIVQIPHEAASLSAVDSTDHTRMLAVLRKASFRDPIRQSNTLR
jgi:hypothetical protein